MDPTSRQVLPSGKARRLSQAMASTTLSSPPLASGSSLPLVSDSSAPSEPSEVITEKSCSACRSRKVKCDRRWPVCARCAERNVQCDFGKMVPMEGLLDIGDGQELQDLERRLGDMEQSLEDIKMRESSVPELLAEGIRASYMSGAKDPGELYQAFGILPPHTDPGTDWRIAQKYLSLSLVHHLLDAFFVSCCAYLSVFEPWHARLHELRSNIDNLSPSAQVAVTAFCAMGARATPHSAALGVAVSNVDISPTPLEVIEAGSRREKACQSIYMHALDRCHRLAIAHDTSIENLESLLAIMQMLVFEELPPRRSRTFVRVALGQLVEILDSRALSAPGRLELVQRLGLPLILGDALIAAYCQKAPIISQNDLVKYFSVANFGQILIPTDSNKTRLENLPEVLDRYIPRTASDGYVSHGHLIRATTTLACWIAAYQRDFGYLASWKGSPLSSVVREIQRIWSGLDQIRAGVDRIQQILVHINYVPNGCESDGCANLHLRFVTRLDREVCDILHLIYVFIRTELLASEEVTNDENILQLLEESENRVRRSLSLLAFYSQLYVTSQDQHMCYHLTFQLELLPEWTTMVTQRYGENPGPRSPDLEVSELKLDWFVRGLRIAAFYYPKARARLHEVEEGRRRRRVTVPGGHLDTSVEI